MRKQETQLILLCLIPVLLVIALCVAVLYRRPDFINLVFALLATASVLLFALVAFTWHRRTFILPLRRLLEEIPSLSASERLRGYPPMLEPVTYSLNQLIEGLSRKHEQEAVTLNAALLTLRETNNALVAQLGSLKESTATAADKTRTLAAACTVAARNIIGFINLLPTTGPGPAVRADIVFYAKTLRTLVAELAAQETPARDTEIFDIRTVVDECLAAVACTGRNRIVPIFDPAEHQLYQGNVDHITSLLFNYLLANTDSSLQTTLPLEVQSSSPGRVTFSATGSVVTLEVPAFASARAAVRLPLSSLVITDDGDEERSLTARLESMGLRIVRDSYHADICLVAADDANVVHAMLDKLPPHTLVLTTKNKSPIARENVLQLRWPIQHAELSVVLGSRHPTEAGRLLALVADDNPANLKLVTMHLKELDFDVVTATDGRAALREAKMHNFALVILDVHMPVLGGPQVAREIRKHLAPDTPLLLSSAQVSPEEAAQVTGADATALLLKPVSKQDLLAYVPRRGPRPSKRSPSQPDILDKTLALKLANERPALAQELLEVLMETLGQDRDDINAAWSNEDREGFRSLVHRLNGGLRYSGVPRLRNAVVKLEAMSRNTDRSQTALALNLFNREVDALIDFYEPTKVYFQ